MGIDRSRRTTFEEVADLYGEAHPGYPDELIEDVIRLSSLLPDGRILEIGWVRKCHRGLCPAWLSHPSDRIGKRGRR